MRNTLVRYLVKTDHEDRYFLTADVGFGVLEPLRDKMKDRLINVGIAEQSMISIASGLALAGKEVFTYTMCCFYLRAVEQIKLDLCYQNAKVTMIGVGTQFDYEYHGMSHFALADYAIIGALSNIDVYSPYSKSELIDTMGVRVERPRYIRVGRFNNNKDLALEDNTKYPKEGGSLTYFRRKYKKPKKLNSNQ